MFIRYAFIIPIMIVMHGIPSFASSSGITGRSISTSGGCGPGGCHGGAGSPAQTRVTIKEAVENTVTIAPNERITLTLSISNASLVAAGFNLTVRATMSGGLRIGTLDNNSDPDIRVSQGELTHSTPRTIANGAAEFTFGWTAPATEGEYYVHATGNAVNRNGGADGGDRWASLTPVKIVVSGTSSVSEGDVAHNALTIAPLPAHGSMTVTAPVQAGESVTLNILDAVGNVIRSTRVVSNEDQLIYVWDGRTDDGTSAAPGSYTVAIIGDRRVWTGRAIVVR